MGEVRRDRDGRWLFVQGRVGRRRITFAIIYSPKEGQDDFLLRLLDRLGEFAVGDIVLAGDITWCGIPMSIGLVMRALLGGLIPAS